MSEHIIVGVSDDEIVACLVVRDDTDENVKALCRALTVEENVRHHQVSGYDSYNTAVQVPGEGTKMQENFRRFRAEARLSTHDDLSDQIAELINGGFTHEEVVDKLDLTAVQLIDELMAATLRGRA
jgi:hypothetical protein